MEQILKLNFRADHYNGKQYLGWKAIRDKLKELEEKRSKNLFFEDKSRGINLLVVITTTSKNLSTFYLFVVI